MTKHHLRRSSWLVMVLILGGVGCGSSSTDQPVSAQDTTTVTQPEPAPPRTTPPQTAPPQTTPPEPAPLEPGPATGDTFPTTIPPPGQPPPSITTLPPGKVRCMIVYGTLLPGEEKDVPVYRADTFEQIATIHLPEGTWTPEEAEDMCA